MADTDKGTTGGQQDDAPRCAVCGSPPPDAGQPGQDVTHCEWCGAEYPLPDED